jgi:hypothetical protein
MISKKWFRKIEGQPDYLAESLLGIKGHFVYAQLVENDPDFREEYFQLIEDSTTGDPGRWAYTAAVLLGMPVERAFNVIKNTTEGEPLRWAYMLARDLGLPTDEVLALIETRSRNVSELAYKIALCRGISGHSKGTCFQDH